MKENPPVTESGITALETERNEAVRQLRRLVEVKGTLHCNYQCGSCLRCRMPQAETFLASVTS